MCKYIQAHFGKKQTAYVVQVTEPGEEAEVDFGYLGLVRDSVSGMMRKAYVFIMTLSYSRRSYYGVTCDQTVLSLIKAHMTAFEYFGGVPRRIKIDNLKAAILQNRRYDLEFNQNFLFFCYHYGCVITPCTPYEPQQKGKVESQVGYVKNNFWAGRTFEDQVDLKRQLDTWMRTYANMLVHGTTKQVPHEMFVSEERTALQSLPATVFVWQERVRRLVKPNCHVNFESNYYSVPHRWVGVEVEVRTSENIIKLYGDDQEIATHVKNSGTGLYVTNPSHYPEHKIYSETGYQAKYEQKMSGIGPHAHELFTILIATDRQGWNQTVRRILGLTVLYGQVKVDKAIKRALQFHAYAYPTIRRICEQNLQDMDVEQLLISPAASAEDTRRSDSLSRSLEYYRV
ncbi:hypothetical protein A3H86_02975 [Candidatus Roizmanbacteria bacterium RIFCSPLOWO2_02_FULL_41_9]|uniref:Integrase catalytic domain-containing protein n=1 Tax=Candidatus Roizmanbacteria bacterium RIFCSPLOWO2_02_FULL_41_9 TaxID=1802077 RepID=A0A1F7JRE2_9BACT|nr:MAG: hypothetical protein A3H86_02975 [Candidatus Roizmanbacteria bacterium RIFCSPLOWO2_02_FULL_41_9]